MEIPLLDHAPEEWQLDTDEGLERLEQKARLMIGRKDFYELPLYDALEAEYGPDRGLNVCGPSSIILARLLHEDTGVPFKISHDRREERLQLRVNAMNHYKDDQTNLQYYMGNGFVLTFDPMLLRIRGRRGKVPGAILTEMHYDHLLQSDLFTYGLQAMNLRWKATDIYPGDIDVPMSYGDILRHMHSVEAFSESCTLSSGEVIDFSRYYGKRLRRVYAHVRRATGTTGPLLDYCLAA